MEKTKSHQFIILAYKESPYLEGCINSLLAQTVQSEIVIATSTPSAFLQQIASRYQLRLSVNPEQKGIASDWNYAYATATAPFVTLAHQDDIYHPEFTEYAVEKNMWASRSSIIFTDYTELVAGRERVYTLNLLIKKMLLFLNYRFGHVLDSVAYKKMLIAFGSPIPCPTVTYHKAQLGEFRFSTEFQINMDWDAWLRLAEQTGSFVYIPQRLVQHRIHPQSATSAGIEGKQRYMEDIQMFSRLWPNYVVNLLVFFYRISYHSNRL